MSAPILVTADLITERALHGGQPALVEFWTPWCLYSLLLKPKTETLSQLIGDRVLVGRLNVEEYMSFGKSLGIEFVPALAFFHGGHLVQKWYGDLPLRAITDVISRYESVGS